MPFDAKIIRNVYFCDNKLSTLRWYMTPDVVQGSLQRANSLDFWEPAAHYSARILGQY